MKGDKLYLIHIYECLQRVDDYVGQAGKESFLASPMMQDAVLRNLQIMAESTQRLSHQSKAAHPEVDWYQIAGFRLFSGAALQLGDIRQGAVPVGVIQPVTDHPDIGDLESQVIHRHVLSGARFAHQHAGVDGGRVALF